MPDERDMSQPNPNQPEDPNLQPDDTEPLLFIVDDEEAAQPTQKPGRHPDDAYLDAHDRPTTPLPAATGAHPPADPQKTLAGSGGLDPNPDFAPPPKPKTPPPAPKVSTGETIPPMKPFEHTMVHVPGETRNYPPANQPTVQRQGGTIPAPGARNYPTQQVGNQMRQPTQQSPYAPPQSTIPAPPGGRGYPPGAPQAGARPGGPPPLPGRRPKRKRILGCTPGCFAIILGALLSFCGGITLLTLVVTATLGSQLEQRLSAQISGVETYNNFESTFFYDRGGRVLYESFTEGRRVNVPFNRFPQDLINATVAIEDDSFYSNPGVELEATARAFLQYVGLASGDSGGSTITQQLVRNVLFEPEYRAERSIQRKVEEILLALLLRQRMSAEEVLELYLNEIYYGNLAYGAQSAAQSFFNKDVSELTLGEAAMLAGLPQSPASLDPFNPDPAVQEAVYGRWALVLDRMVTEGYITDAQRQNAISTGLNFVAPAVPLEAPHFTVYAMSQFNTLMETLGVPADTVARGGFRVYTTVDQNINNMARQMAADQVAALARNNVTNAAVLVMQPTTGEILAMVGSVDYNNDAIDGRVNVTISLRQPGSTMKPFTYSSAIENGMTPADIIWDTQTVIGDYTPVNYDGTFHGPVRMRDALANSYNIPAVQTLRRIGVDSLLELMRRFGVDSLSSDASQYGLSLTLGGGDITLLELTNAYSVFANGGSLVGSTAIRCVLDGDGNIIYQYREGCPNGSPTDTTVYNDGFGTQVLDPRIAFLMSDIMADEQARQPAMGFRSPLFTGDIGSSVKTGTTNDFKDNWTVGFTRNVAVGVWVGNSDGTPMNGVSGLAGAAPIWNDVITGIYSNPDMLARFAVNGQLQPDRLEQPGGMSMRNICSISGLRDPAVGCAGQTSEWMLDSPAGLFDGNGIFYPPAPAPTQDIQPPSGVWMREVEPSIYNVVVVPLPQSFAQGIVFQVAPGQPQPPYPLYCQVPMELIPIAQGAREQLFIAPPSDPGDAARAEQYARSAGLAFLPTIACSQDLINAAGSTAPGVTAYIASPANGQVVSGPFDIIGTAQFDAGQASYYKVEIIGGPFGGWTTVNNIHSNSVVNGVLESIPGLSPGNYQLQLVVVGNDGNYAQPPYQISITVP
ncbi:MAG: transglycosylase domain-containing protein [Pleurocapsa minor GSE-CHR-MK-17-07R]|jgi:penicillin-binding protein 1C|nr:transglycosylase domain-containing protein [Pleurocapsa minor GSE-CHR-MK 17-07R]